MTQRSYHFDLFVANAVSAKIRRRFHGRKAKELEQVVLYHVAQGACAFVIAGASPDTQRFSRRDLHMIDVVRVPQRRENRVGKPENEDVLGGFLAEKMVDSIGLLFCKRIVDNAIELARRGKIRSERLFDDYAHPASFARLVQAGSFQVLENWFELVRACRKIKKAIAARAVSFIDFIEAFDQLLVTGLVAKLALVIKNRLPKRLPNFVAHRLARKLARRFFEIAAEFLVTFFSTREPDNRHRRRQLPIGRNVIKRRDEFAMGEIARGTEDHNAARLRHSAGG